MITAANSSQISDGSAALLITTSEKAAELGLTPIARIHTAVAGRRRPDAHADRADPGHREGARQQSGLTIDEIGAFEVNEAFASVPLAWLTDIGADEKALNPNGGAIALGHPLGGSGARHDDHAGAPHARQRHPLRPADHVRGRRPGQRHHPRAALDPSQHVTHGGGHRGELA